MMQDIVPDGDEGLWPLDEDVDKDVLEQSTLILLSDFWGVLDWMSKNGKGSVCPFSIGIDGDEPEGVRRVLQRLNNLTVDDFVFSDTDQDNMAFAISGKSVSSGTGSFEGALEQVISEFDARDRDIFIRRYTKTIADSLESIGKDYGITRERVRQLDASVHERIEVVFERFGIWQKLLSLFEQNIPFSQFKKAIESFPEFDSVLPVTNASIVNIISAHYRNQFRFEVKDGWVATPSISDAQTLFRTVLSRESNKYGVVPESALIRLIATSSRDMTLETLKNWLRYSGAAFYKRHIILKPSKIAMILSVLSIEQRPMSAEEIAVAIRTDTTIAGLSNILSSNPETIRVNKDDWGLREWGKKPYVSVRQLIYDKIRGYGGAMNQRQLIDELVDEYFLNIRTVYHYCSEAPFRTVKGIISITDEEGDDPVCRLFKEEGLEFLDYRDRGGSLWVIGDLELEDVMDELRAKGFTFHYRAEGGRATKGRSAWWWKP